MDTHHKGPVANGYGAVPVSRGLNLPFGEAAQTTEILRTQGASAGNPLHVEIIGVQTTALDGTTPVATLHSTLLDGSGGVDEVVVAGIATPKNKIITADRIYSMVYDPDDSTEGEVGYVIRVSGLGQLS